MYLTRDFLRLKFLCLLCLHNCIVDLQVVGNLSSITLYNDTAEIALSCEMSLYLRPDEDLQWFENGELINATTEMENYTISYSYGSESGQFGGAGVGLSRVSTLVISQPSDSATYTCAIRNTQLSHDINITVKTGKLALIFNYRVTVLMNQILKSHLVNISTLYRGARQHVT